mmetsp:Transcript_26841/g.60675  ORF Transcript_26841/g.60675 Transcript_26841/m.60675 type:complete len:284 (-) Transcript_26841:50-901(-)
MRAFRLCALLVAPCAAQFGVGANRRNKGGASSFEELNKLAAERASKEDNGGLDLSAMMGDVEAMMKDMDPNQLQELMMEGMKDPQMQEMFEGMQGAMEELLNMDPDQLKAQMNEAMAMLTSADMQQNILDQKDDVLALMEAQGTATAAEIAEYKANPESFQNAMTEAFGQMKEILNDPSALNAVVETLQGFGNIMKDPDAAMSKLGEVLQDALSDDDKIEEARMQLLSDPSVAGNKAISDMFGSEQMKEILNDPVKWKKSVKEGQKMLTGGGNKPAVVGMGEL